MYANPSPARGPEAAAASDAASERTDAGAWVRLLAALTASTAAAAALAVACHADPPCLVAAHGLPPEAETGYRKLWLAQDPWIAAVPRDAVPGTVLSGARLLHGPLLRGTPFWHSFLAPLGLDEALLGLAPGGVWLILLRKASTRFTPRDHAVLRTTLAALRLAAAAPLPAPLASPETRPELALSEALDGSTLPLLVLRPEGAWLWGNTAGRALLDRAGPLRLLGQRVTARHGRAGAEFARALAEAAVRPVLLRVPDADGGPRLLRLTPAPAGIRRSGPGSAVPAVLLAADPGFAWRPDPALLAQALGLTRVQGEIASLICAGLGTAQIAARMRLNEHTLRAHLSTLLNRAGADKRVSLVAHVMQRVAPLLLLGEPALLQVETQPPVTAEHSGTGTSSDPRPARPDPEPIRRSPGNSSG